MSTFWRDQRRRVNARYSTGSLDRRISSERRTMVGTDRQRMGERIVNARTRPATPMGQIKTIMRTLKTGRLPVGSMPMARRARALRHSRTLARGALIAADQGANEATMAWLAAVAPALARVIEERWIPVAERAVEYFPVDTGLARDSMTFSLVRTGDQMRLMISNPVRYMHYIRWAQKDGNKRERERRQNTLRAMVLGLRMGRSPWWDLVRRPVDDAARQMVDDLAREIERQAGRSR